MHDPELTTRVRALVEQMYGGYLAGDRGAIDALLDPELTMFDSASAPLISGMDELNAVRAARVPASDSPAPRACTETALTPSRFTARRIGDVVSATWWLRIDGVDAAGAAVVPELVRNSAVLVESGDALRIAQLHEDVLQSLGGEQVAGLPEVAGLNTAA